MPIRKFYTTIFDLPVLCRVHNLSKTSVREWFETWRALTSQQLQQLVVIFLFIVAPERGKGLRELLRHVPVVAEGACARVVSGSNYCSATA